MGQCQAHPCSSNMTYDNWAVFAWLSESADSPKKGKGYPGSLTAKVPRHFPHLHGASRIGLGKKFCIFSKVSEGGGVHVWGNLPGVKKRSKAPTLVDIPLRVTQFACGKHHAILLSGDQGIVYAAGRGKRGQLGLSHSHKSIGFQRIISLSDERIIKVDCGLYHSVALSSTGTVFAWGGGTDRVRDFALGTGRSLDCYTPTPVQGLPEDIIDIRCGDYFTVAISRRGLVYIWGRNTDGQCGVSVDEAAVVVSPRVVQGILLSSMQHITVGPASVVAYDTLLSRPIAWGAIVGTHEAVEIPDPIHLFPNVHMVVSDEGGYLLAKSTGALYSITHVGPPRSRSLHVKVFPYLGGRRIQQLVYDKGVCLGLSIAEPECDRDTTIVVAEALGPEPRRGARLGRRYTSTRRRTTSRRDSNDRHATPRDEGDASNDENENASAEVEVADQEQSEGDEESDGNRTGDKADRVACAPRLNLSATRRKRTLSKSSHARSSRDSVPASALDDIALLYVGGSDDEDEYDSDDDVSSDLNPEQAPRAGSMYCPLSGVLMSDPVFAVDGHTYERVAIQSWLSENDTSPVTGEVLNYVALIPNFTMRSQIEAVMGEKGIPLPSDEDTGIDGQSRLDSSFEMGDRRGLLVFEAAAGT